jgi:hypothetical protein
MVYVQSIHIADAKGFIKVNSGYLSNFEVRKDSIIETSHPDESGHRRMIIGEFHLTIKKQIIIR